ncbi:hypothetical protein ES705_23181 [subsurface metagenome]
MRRLNKMPKFNFGSLIEKKPIPEQEDEKIEKKLISPEPKKSIDSLIESKVKPKKLIIASDLDLLSKSLEQTIGFDISNVNISQDDLWLLYRLKFGIGTRTKRSVLLPQFTEAFNRNLEKMKK